MDNVAVIVLVVGGIAYAAYAIPVIFQFLAYCERVAAASGRTKENASLINQDDGGLNTFQCEQFCMLRSGEFMNFGDSALINLGAIVARKLKVSFWGAVLLILSAAAADICAK
ncbi:hypothetical protein GM658_14250 [Pseudoduganella eburnea]|uniref:Uncharacterized protein n=1 Tax=Massilia eburnea TaxID=1776165 RepID=A0A6L6QI82_9BURK|nr:hypothetical protein [Massilia eburnea]MTW11764.1 hypothetical protein [Massilia eburnea]